MQGVARLQALAKKIVATVSSVRVAVSVRMAYAAMRRTTARAAVMRSVRHAAR